VPPCDGFSGPRSLTRCSTGRRPPRVGDLAYNPRSRRSTAAYAGLEVQRTDATTEADGFRSNDWAAPGSRGRAGCHAACSEGQAARQPLVPPAEPPSGYLSSRAWS
jgi:hypothetical protein